MARGEKSRVISGTHSYSHYKEPFHEKPFYHYIIIILLIAALTISIIALKNTNELKKALVPTTINVNDFLNKLALHDEMKPYAGIAPLNIIQITGNNLGSLQSQISGLDTSYIGDHIVQYSDTIILYNYNSDLIKGSVSLQQPQLAQLPDDFFAKLNNHPELQGLQNQQPIGGQLDQVSLEALKQQFPDVYANAKAGDFLLRYQTKLIVYDYAQDSIVNAVELP